MRHRKFKLSVGVGQKYLYEGNWSDEDRHLDWPKRASLYGGKWSIYIVIIFYNFFVKNTQKT